MAGDGYRHHHQTTGEPGLEGLGLYPVVERGGTGGPGGEAADPAGGLTHMPVWLALFYHHWRSSKAIGDRGHVCYNETGKEAVRGMPISQQRGRGP